MYPFESLYVPHVNTYVGVGMGGCGRGYTRVHVPVPVSMRALISAPVHRSSMRRCGCLLPSR